MVTQHSGPNYLTNETNPITTSDIPKMSDNGTPRQGETGDRSAPFSGKTNPNNPSHKKDDFLDASSQHNEQLNNDNTPEIAQEHETLSREEKDRRVSMHITKALGEFEIFEEVNQETFDKWNREERSNFFEQAQRFYKEVKDLMKSNAAWPVDRRRAEACIADLEQEVADLQQGTQALQELILDKNTEIKVLERNLVNFSKDQIVNAREGTLDNSIGFSHSAMRIEKLPHPKEYTNETGVIRYEDWKLEIQNKLEQDAEAYPTAARRIAYIYAHTGGDAKDTLKPGIQQKELKTVEAVWELLDESFDNPNKEEEAEKKMAAHDMRKEPIFHLFIAKFKRYAATLQYNEEKKHKEFVKRLNIQYITALGISAHIMTFDQIVSALLKFSKTLEGQKNLREANKAASDDKTKPTGSAPSESNASRSQGRPAFDPMATRSSRYEAVLEKHKKGILTQVFRTEDEKSALRGAGLCYKCTKEYHGRDEKTGAPIRCPEKEWVLMPTNLVVLKSKN